jgi:hypothetical protein
MKISTYTLAARPTPGAQKLTVDQVFTHPSEPPSLAEAITSGSKLYLKPLGIQSLGIESLIGPLGLPLNAKGGFASPPIGAPVSGLPATPSGGIKVTPGSAASVVQAPLQTGEGKGELWPKLFGAVSAGGVATGSLHLMTFSQDMTQAQVSGHLQTWGLQPSLANTTADNVFDLLNTHGAHAVLAGVTVGSATVAFLGVVRPAMPMKKRVAIGLIPTALVALAFFYFAYKPNPFAGKWVASPAEARYEFGTPPQSATTTVEANASKITISEDQMLPNGTVQHTKFALESDGKEHVAPTRSGADTVSASIKDRLMEAEFKLNGKEVRHQTWSLSADRKEMTVTISGTRPEGGVFVNTSTYEKK